ncbi:DUF885 domain-containing protein [Spongiimicrobium sp. 3-5]|uniref:DUF885 domain-containing protein n=1 Tax=Spongiimicrobium sp. 3-5 TaxID=3332596 RepID=UPI00397ED6BA
MGKLKIYWMTLCIATLVVACKTEPKIEKDNNNVATDFEAFLMDYYEEGLRLNPLDATFQGDYRFNDQLPNILSDEFTDKTKAYYTKYKSRLEEFDDTSLSENEKMTKAILTWDFEVNLEGFNYRSDLMPIDQFNSFNLTIGQLASGKSAVPFNTVQDYMDWLKRLDQYLEWMSSAEVKMKEGVKAGYVLPKSLIVKALPQLKVLINDNLDEHIFYAPIKNFPENFSEREKDQLTTAYSKMISEKIIPAYKNMYNYMSTDYLDAGRMSSGISDIPQGEAYYDYLIKVNTTTDMKADEIHQIGLSEVKRILSEMEEVKAEVGYKGDLKSFFNYVRSNRELMPFTEAQQVIDNFYAIHDRMKPQLEKLFDKRPKTAFEVKQVEAFREASASAHYDPGSLDGTRPGVFYTPILDVTEYNTYLDESTFLHEAIPGHHYQVSLTQENEELPHFRKTQSYSGYDEGWALYTESLGKELGLYEDPYQYFGMLDAEMHRAIRLVVDTGLHSKGWTREQAIEYSLDNEAASETSIISEIERYMVIPGQALSYKIGQLKIRELRAKAEAALGDDFDIREFHNQVLETGSIPLALLENKINEWIRSKKAKG